MAVRYRFQPRWVVGPEKPYPGSDGITRWKSCDSGAMIFRYSMIEPGQPWVSISGSASSRGERTCRKWMFCPSIPVVNCGYLLTSTSHLRQSYSCRQ